MAKSSSLLGIEGAFGEADVKFQHHIAFSTEPLTWDAVLFRRIEYAERAGMHA